MSNNESFIEVISRGQTMRGMLHRPPEWSAARRFPAVLMWHGFTGTRIEPHRLFVSTARRLAREGFVVARLDFIGNGESDGEFVDVTPETEIEDALTALSWMQAQAGVDRTRIGLIGLSLGGLVSACAAARSGQIKALCLWAATAHMGRRMEERSTPEARAFLEQNGFVDLGGTRVGRAFFESALRVQPLHEATKYFGRALVVHGSDDPTVPVIEAREYAQALQSCEPKLHIIDGADHTFNRVAWESELSETTASWLRENL